MIRHTNKAQALLELSILSAILIFAIGALVSIGINYNRNQELNMRAHRNAMALAYKPVFRNHTRQVNLTMLEDQPVMEATGPDRQKAIIPYVASAGGVWSNKIYYDYDLIDLDDVDLSSFSGIEEFLEDLVVSYLDLPSTQYLINQQLHYLPTGMYTIRASILNGGFKHEDMYEYGTKDAPLDECVPAGISWVKCWVPAKDIDESDRVDIDLDNKEELILDKLSLEDITDALGIGEYIPTFIEDLLDSTSIFLVLDDQTGAVDMTKDSVDIAVNDALYTLNPGEYESVHQGLQGKYSQENTLEEATLSIKDDQESTENRWTTDSSSETTHYIKYNPGSGRALASTLRDRLEDAGISGLGLPAEEISENMTQNEIVIWKTVK